MGLNCNIMSKCPVRDRRKVASFRFFFCFFSNFGSIFLIDFLTKYQKLYHHSIGNFTQMPKMGLFLIFTVQLFEIINQTWSTVKCKGLRGRSFIFTVQLFEIINQTWSTVKCIGLNELRDLKLDLNLDRKCHYQPSSCIFAGETWFSHLESP